MNQSELETETRNQRQARGKNAAAAKRGKIDTSHFSQVCGLNIFASVFFSPEEPACLIFNH